MRNDDERWLRSGDDPVPEFSTDWAPDSFPISSLDMARLRKGKCPYCGAYIPIDDTSTSCPKCGAPRKDEDNESGI